MNTILEDFLELKEILKSFNGVEKKYNWLLTDLDGSYLDDYLDYFIDYRLNNQDSRYPNSYLITGENLTKLADIKGIYFIWGVFSAIEKCEFVDLDAINMQPYADGNPNFWVENPVIQHPSAVAELVLWDSTFILLLSKGLELSSSFRKTFKGWKDLNVYNRI
ncbi:hypothetical protein B481_3128 [Planococcus halocryophilus Or1]|uniref:hypothetical protein n=1 Tax=Planococcus halocryophilus TaxID=1215089 RepID=UPI0002B8AB21|nr:hypothetical protein [Planococcus halocryophilus]EMF45573.1 hypothetical protein B481_3128 [Planococcus halocryophilus Or1]